MSKVLKRIKYQNIAITFLCIIMIVGVYAIIKYESKEALLNKEVRLAEIEIAKLETEIDGLDMKKQELVSFDRIGELAEAKGYTYKHNTTTALAIGVSAE